MDGNSSQVCPDPLLHRFSRSMASKMWRVNGLMLVNAILMGIVVSLGVCAPRARRKALLGFLLLAASTLFLPIVSDVTATVGTDTFFTGSLYDETEVVAASCEPGLHAILVLVWTAVVLTIAGNTSIVAVTDAREGRTKVPPGELLIQAIWVLILILLATSARTYVDKVRYIGNLLAVKKIRSTKQLDITLALVMIIPFCKMIGTHIVFQFAKGWVEFGRSTQLVVGYMSQISESQNIITPPKLIVWAHEKCYKLVEEPRGFSLDERKHNLRSSSNNDDGSGSEMEKIVTFDRIWEYPDLKREHKDLCFSYALFKLLRCRFAKYTVAEAGFPKAQSFFRREYLRGSDHDRAFDLIANELSFINSYYNSSLPIHSAVPYKFVLLTLLSIGYCCYMFVFISRKLYQLRGNEQVLCFVWCPGQTTQQTGFIEGTEIGFGNTFFEVIPVYLALAVLLLSEVKDAVYYLCSNRTKVTLICRYLQHPCSPVKKYICFVLNCFRCSSPFPGNENQEGARSELLNSKKNCCRCKFVNGWGQQMSQFSVLTMYRKEESINDLKVVKKYVFRTLITKLNKADGQQGAVKMLIPPPKLPVTVPDTEGNTSASGYKSVADTILAWHIATSLFELKDQATENPSPQASDPEDKIAVSQPLDPEENKIAATQLSRYCAYLVACHPELLPDEDEWCKKLYADVLEHAHRVLRVAGEGAGFQQMVNLLRAIADDSMVLKNGVTIAEKLPPNNGWEQLADFWLELILYIAPSENLDGHAEAIARGGEMVTLLWALLAHAGIVDRVDDGTAD